MGKRKTSLGLRVMHYIFDVGITLKYINGTLEIIGAFLLLFINYRVINRTILTLLTSEALEDPHDIFIKWLLHGFQALSVSTHVFICIYLLIHGIINIALVIALVKKKKWAYPAALIALFLFTVYQLYLYYDTRGLFTLALAIIDMIILIALHYEYEYVKAQGTLKKKKRTQPI